MKKNNKFFSWVNIVPWERTCRIMKVLFILMTVTLVSFATGTYSQSKNLTFRLEKVNLIEIFEQIEKQSDLKVAYDVSNINTEKRINISVDDASIENVLNKALENTDLSYRVINHYVIISSKENELSTNVQQQKSVSGKVTDSTGGSLPGVSVVVKGTTTGVITDMDGKYSLLKIPENAILQFSFVGMKMQEISVGTKTTINITLADEAIGIEEVVAIGYGTMKKSDLTGSVSSVKAEDLKSIAATSIGSALQGRASGVQIISSGTPGSNEAIRIRGTGTINNNDPLLVVDGIPTNGGLNQFNLDDVESIQILKDASSTAIYGSRGANGVIIITTKMGTANKGQINFSFYSAVQSMAKQVPLLNASQFAKLHNEMLLNAGVDQNPDFSNPQSLGNGTDWIGELFNPAPIQNYSLSYSGGNDKTTYYVSGSYLDQEGIVLETGFKRLTVKLNSETQLLKGVKFGNMISLNNDIKTRGDYNIKNTMNALPTQKIIDENGIYTGPKGRPDWYGDTTNPIGKARLVDNTTKGYNMLGAAFTEINIFPGLMFKSSFGIEAHFWDTKTWSPKYEWKPIPQPYSSLAQSYNKSITWNWDNTLNYSRTISDKHKIIAMIGTSAQSNTYSFISGSVQKFASDLTKELGNGSYDPRVNGNTTDWSLMSYMGRLNYSFADKYLFTATVRRDGSSRFGKKNKWGIFPSTSFAWRISEEEFLKDNPIIDDLKLRVGYGVTGNQEIGLYSFAANLKPIVYNFNNVVVNAVVPFAMPNPNVKWESQSQTNIGIDAVILNQRLSISIDAYSKRTNDMLVPMSVPLFTGYSDQNPPFVNAGEIRNSGIELTVSSDNLKGDLKWTTDFNISYNRNKVLALNDSVPLIGGRVNYNSWVTRIAYGQPVNVFYGFVTDGVFQTQQEVDNHAVQMPGNDPYNRTSAGDIRFKDLNNDVIIDDKDRTYIGDPNPKLIFALNNTFRYKGFDLNIFLQGITGNDIYNANRVWNEGMDITLNQTTATLNRWTGEGTSNSMPRAVLNDPNKNARASNRFLEDGSYIRLKNASFGYNLPGIICQKAKLRTARVYISGTNLLTLTKYKGFDPEVPSNGIDDNTYPVTRTISIGLNLGF